MRSRRNFSRQVLLSAAQDVGASHAGPSVFQPPAPEDFTNGTVYACRDADRPEFGLFGPEDSGRFDCVATARKAVAAMDAIQPANMQGVFFYPPTFDARDLRPDVVLLSVRPVALTKLLQSYQYVTGRPIRAHMNPLRAVDADLIARPYLTGEINLSCYCLGARTLARFDGNRMGVGIPMAVFERLLEGMAASATGYPYCATTRTHDGRPEGASSGPGRRSRPPVDPRRSRATSAVVGSAAV